MVISRNPHLFSFDPKSRKSTHVGKQSNVFKIIRKLEVNALEAVVLSQS